MDPIVERELWAQAAKGLALENLLFSLLSELQRSGVLDAAAFGRLLDQAEEALTATAMKLGSQAPPEYGTGALKIVEQIRANFGLPKT
jgi:hypothetical protein